MNYEPYVPKEQVFISSQTISRPKYEAYVIIGGQFGLKCSVNKYPCWLHRVMAKLLLGFEYEKVK